MLSLRFAIPSPVSADEERVPSYWATSEGLREGRWGGPADLQTSGSRRSVLGNPSFALRSLSTVIPDPLEGTLRRLDGTAARGRSRTMTTRPALPPVRSVPRVDH